jgi:hypothetical protein
MFAGRTNASDGPHAALGRVFETPVLEGTWVTELAIRALVWQECQSRQGYGWSGLSGLVWLG